MKKTTLIKTIIGTDSIIFIMRNGRREKLSDCGLKICIYEDSIDVPTLGGIGKVKTYRAAAVICSDINKNVDVGTLDACYLRFRQP